MYSMSDKKCYKRKVTQSGMLETVEREVATIQGNQRVAKGLILSIRKVRLILSLKK